MSGRIWVGMCEYFNRSVNLLFPNPIAQPDLPPVVVLLGQNVHLRQRIEQLPGQQFVSALPVEALHVCVLRRRTRLDVQGAGPTSVSHSLAALAVNSWSLSGRICSGTPLPVISSAGGSMTSGGRILRPARMARDSLVYSSMTVNNGPDARPGTDVGEVVGSYVASLFRSQPDGGPVVQT